MKGRVTDESGAPVIGATVILKGTTIGTATNAMGEYAIDIRQADAVLVYSLIGYNKVELALADNQTQADVTLKSEAIAMDNVVVVGYGVQNKRDVTTAISSIKAEDFAAMPTADFRDAMAAKMPGVQVLTLGGQPDGNVSIRIRGIPVGHVGPTTRSTSSTAFRATPGPSRTSKAATSKASKCSKTPRRRRSTVRAVHAVSFSSRPSAAKANAPS